MDLSRAQQILISPVEYDVLHQGEPVWIESIDEESRTAIVHRESEDGTKRESYPVPIEQLKEVQ